MNLQENNQLETNFIIIFINIQCAQLSVSRETKLQNWSAFDDTETEQYNFSCGIKQIDFLCSKYKDFLTKNTIKVNQYHDLKF